MNGNSEAFCGVLLIVLIIFLAIKGREHIKKTEASKKENSSIINQPTSPFNPVYRNIKMGTF